jgi:hypothetical protein
MGIIYDTPIFKRLLSLLPVKFLHISLTKSEYAEIHTWFVGYNCSNSLFTINPSPRWRVCDVTAEILNSTIFAIKKMNWEFLVELRSHYEFIAKKNPARHKSCSTSTYPEESIFRVATDSVWRDDKSCRRWGPPSPGISNHALKLTRPQMMKSKLRTHCSRTIISMLQFALVLLQRDFL